MRELILLRGLPGSGKSTVAKLLAEDSHPIYSADDFFEDVHGNYNFEASKLKEAHGWCLRKTEKAMISAANDIAFSKIFVANTFTREWEMEKYYALANKYGFTVHHIIIENRHGSSNIHNVPDETLNKMKERFEVKL